MAKVLDTRAYLDEVCRLLDQGQQHVAVPVTGGSMIPFLHNGDTVYLDLPDTPLRKGDVVLTVGAGDIFRAGEALLK